MTEETQREMTPWEGELREALLDAREDLAERDALLKLANDCLRKHPATFHLTRDPDARRRGEALLDGLREWEQADG